jgi:hypothetical protein
MMDPVTINGIEYEGQDGITSRRSDFLTFLANVNGCGAGPATIDLVPDTNYFRSIKVVCNLHDDSWVFCAPTREAFNETNLAFLRNHERWAKAVSNMFMVKLRLRRAKTYYWFVQSDLGWSAFKECKLNLGTPVI